MATILSCEDDFSAIRKPILSGATIIYPTDTVYGLGTNPLSESGVLRCFELKSREENKPMPVLCSSLETAEKLVELGSEGLCLARAFWPGKLSIVAPAKLDFPNILLDKDNSLAVRVPNHECCLRLIEACGGSLVGTSANVSGEKPFLDSENTGLQDFASGADYLVKGVCGSDGLPSTVVKLSADGNLTIVREGAVPPRDIKKLSFK